MANDARMRVIVHGVLLASVLGCVSLACSGPNLEVVPTPPPSTSEAIAQREGQSREPEPDDLDTADVSHHLALGHGFSCALRPNRDVVCWGRLPTRRFGVAPTRMPELAGAIAIDAGPSALCARFEDGRVACRGFRAGELAVDEPEIRGATEITLTYSAIHAVVDGEVRRVFRDGVSDATRAEEIERFDEGRSWRSPECLVDEGDRVRCRTSRTGLAASLTFEPEALAVASGNDQVCVVRPGDIVECAGLDDDGEASGDPRRLGSPARIPIPNALAIAASSRQRCVLASEGALWCWSGAAGHETPARMEGLPPIVEIASSIGAVLARGADGSVHEIDEDRVREERALRGATALGRGGEWCARIRGRERCLARMRAPVLRALAGASTFGVTDSVGCGLRDDVLRCAPIEDEPAFTLRGVRSVFFGPRRVGMVLADGTAQMHRTVWDPDGVPTSMPLEPMTLPSAAVGMAMNDPIVCVWNALGAIHCANLRGRYSPEWGAMPVDAWEPIEGSEHVIDAFVDDRGVCALTAMHEVVCWSARGSIGTGNPRWSTPTQIVMP